MESWQVITVLSVKPVTVWCFSGKFVMIQEDRPLKTQI
jgi:hypothetical protein